MQNSEYSIQKYHGPIPQQGKKAIDEMSSPRVKVG